MGRTASPTRRLLDQRQLARLDYGLELGVDAQLAAQAADVRTHRRVADPEPGRDFAARRPLRHHPQHLFLARREPFELRLDLPPAVEELRNRARGEKRSTLRDGADGVDDVLRRA